MFYAEQIKIMDEEEYDFIEKIWILVICVMKYISRGCQIYTRRKNNVIAKRLHIHP